MSTPVGTHSLNLNPVPTARSLTDKPNPLSRTHIISTLDGIGFTRRIVGVPKAESDAMLAFLFAQIGQNHDFQVRFKWQPNDVAIWDNRVSVSLSPLFTTQLYFPHPLIICPCD